jgi:tape measure domain-containing protein
MATDVERLVAVLEARTTAFEKAMNKAVGVSHQRARQIEQRFDQMNAGINRSFQTLLRSGAAMVGGLGLREIQQMADTWTDFSARVGLAVKNMDAAPAVMERIYQIAQRTYSALDTTAESFIANANTLRELGRTTREQLDYTEALNNALVVSGAKAQRAESVQNALAKAMAAGKLSGENLNTVIQQGGRVAEVLADELGISTLELGRVGQQGKITGDVIYAALTKRLETLRDEADAMPATISDGFLKIRNALTRYIGQLDQASGVSGVFAQGLVFVADNFDSVAAAAAVAGAMLIGRYVPGLVRATAAQAAMVATNPFLLLATAIGGATFALHAFGGEVQPVAGELASLHDYAGAAWDAISNGAMSAAGAVRDGFLDAINLIVEAMGGVSVGWEDVWNVIKRIANQIIGEMHLVYDTVVVAFTKLPQAVAESVVNAMNSMVALIEAGINKVIDGVNRAIGALNSLGSLAGVSDMIGQIGAVELGRLENAYAGAGAAAANAYGDALRKAAQDHIGAVGEAWRRAANDRAAARDAGIADGDAAFGAGGAVRMPTALGGGGSGGGRGRKERENELQREIEKIRERTAALILEADIQSQLNPLIDDYGYALTKARATQDLLNAAKKAGIAVTPELRAKIEDLAEGYANATVAANQLAEAQDKARKMAEDMRALGKDVLGGFIKDLQAGKSASEALADALGKVADKLLDIALNSMFEGNGLFGGMGKGGLLGGFLIPGILHKGGLAGHDGYGHGRAVSPSLFAGAKRYHRGGIAGLQPGEVPAILQRGEVVLPRGSRVAAAPPSNVRVEQHFHIEGAISSKDVQLMVRQGATQAVDTVKRSLTGWQHQMARDGSLA